MLSCFKRGHKSAHFGQTFWDGLDSVCVCVCIRILVRVYWNLSTGIGYSFGTCMFVYNGQRTHVSNYSIYM